MKRLLIPIVLVVALVLPATAQAVRYRGPVAGGANNSEIEFSVRFRHGDPVRVSLLGWANIPLAHCGGTNFEEWPKANPIHVNGQGRFHATHNFRDGVTATIAGHFKRHPRRAAGTLTIAKSLQSCSDTDAWTAKPNT